MCFFTKKYYFENMLSLWFFSWLYIIPLVPTQLPDFTNFNFYLVYQVSDDTIDCRLGKCVQTLSTTKHQAHPRINRPQNERLDRGVSLL